jgi:multisubunit Na+/H+ antiporter MnhC subunit
MNDLFMGLFSISFVALVVGIIKPSIFSRIFRKNMTRKKLGLIFGGITIILFILTGVTGGTTPPKETPPPATNQSDEQAAQKEAAQKELSEIIDLGKKADLVVSYEFSDSATVVYIGPTWYTQTVAFKKDFMAKIGTLKQQITGYTHFEVRDAYSNEKVGEIKAFSQSIEVYK